MDHITNELLNVESVSSSKFQVPGVLGTLNSEPGTLNCFFKDKIFLFK